MDSAFQGDITESESDGRFRQPTPTNLRRGIRLKNSAPRYLNNFRDPVGLTLRMLRSGNRAAYSALIRAALGLVAVPLDRVLASGERRLLESGSSVRRHPILLIVGPPRSGTTLVYQVLAAYLHTTHFTNLSELFPNSPISATELFRMQRRPYRPDYQSYYGNSAGLRAPNDGFHVWNRWLGADRYKVAEELGATEREEMNRFFDTWTSVFDKPFLNKNNRNSSCITLLASALDRARFIVVRRDPVFVVQSLIQARKVIQGSKAYGWGLGSKDQDPSATSHSYIADVCEQVRQIEIKLARDIGQIDPSRIIEVQYEDFCQHPASLVAEVSEKFLWIKADTTRIENTLKAFRHTNQPIGDPEEFERIRRQASAFFNSSSISNDRARHSR